jgi:hypothetical protein
LADLIFTCDQQQIFTITPAKVFFFYFILTISGHLNDMTTAPTRATRIWTRRLSDKLRLVFHAACDEAEFSVAEQLLNQLHKYAASPSSHPTGLDRRSPEDLSGVSERLANLLLWHLENRAELTTQADEGWTSRPPRGQ